MTDPRTPEERFIALVRTDVEQERAFRDMHGKGGQNVGRGPSWPMNHLLELERYLRWYDEEKKTGVRP
jgi:hypothetical protein